MTSVTPWQLDLWAWYVCAGYWAIGFLKLKPVKTAQPAAQRLAHVSLLCLAFYLVFAQRARFGVLAQRFLPESGGIPYLGVALTFVGVAIAIWARYCIGQYWSGRVTLKEDHQLIRSGPYAYVRHPIYTGLGLAILGAAVVNGEWHSLIGAVLAIAEHARKAKAEEALLTTEFGEKYSEYRKQTGFLIPRLPG